MRALIGNDIFPSLFDAIPAMPSRPSSSVGLMERPVEFEEEEVQIGTQSISLYDWQGEAADALRRNIREGIINQILASPTGSGKTVIGAHLINECLTKKKRAIFICDRIPLIDQTSKTFDRFGIPHGIIQADHWRTRPWERIQIASAQTLARRRWPDDIDLIVVDEAHTTYTNITKKLLERGTVCVGLSATPFTKGLGKIYDRVVNVRTLNQLTQDGYLAPFDAFAASEPDMAGAKMVAGEWTDAEAEKRALPIIGDIVQEYLRHGQNKKFILFGVNVKHCEQLQRQFTESGVICGLYTYQTGEEERDEMVKEFRKPDSYIRGLISVSALAKGFDVEDIGVVILARPLRNSFAEHIQMLGRGLRRDPNNPTKRCIVLDHSGNLLRFWKQMADFFEHGVVELDDGRKKEAKPKEIKAKEPMKCPKCAHLHQPAPMCGKCGHEYPKRNTIHHVAGELSPLSKQPTGTLQDMQSTYSGLLAIGRERGKADGWAAHLYKQRFGNWPDQLHKVEMDPTPELRKWVLSQQIRNHKGRSHRGRKKVG